MERLQSHQGPDTSADQDLVANVVFQDVGKFLGICCKMAEEGDTVMHRVVTGEVKGQKKIAVVSSEQDNSLNKQKCVPSAHCVHSPRPTISLKVSRQPCLRAGPGASRRLG